MRKTILASVTALAAGAGLAFGQGPPMAPSDPAAISATGQPMQDPNLVPVFGREPLYLQGGPPYGGPPQGGCGPHNTMLGHFCNHGGQCGPQGCGQGCDDGSGGSGGACGADGCAPASNPYQVHRAAGGPDCFYFDVEALYLLPQAMAFSAPIFSAGPIGTTARLNEDGVRILAGDNDLRYNPLPGLRLNMGFWFQDRVWGLGGNAWLTEQRAEVDDFSGPATGRTVIARPNFNVLTGVPDSVLVASPPDFGGAASLYTNIRMGGAEVNLLRNWAYYDKFKLTGLAGFRWASLNEQMRVDSLAVIPGADPADPSLRYINDTISTRNNFYGGQLGFDTEIRRGRWFTNITAKAAAGFVHEKLNMSGFTRSTDGGISNTIPYGALVLEPNSGNFSKKEFAYMPEANVKLGFQWTQRFSTYIGYDFMYLSKVVRPGDQISANVNPTLLPISGVYNPQFPFGPAEPALKFATNDFIMQGLQLGMTLRY